MSSTNSTGMLVTENVSRVGLGYGIAIAVGIVVLVSAIMLASYVCVRVQGRARNGRGNGSAAMQGTNGATIVPQASSLEEGNAAEWITGGLDQTTIDSYPKIVFSGQQQQLPHSQDTACSICLGDYKYQEILRVMPDCRHCFHAPCVDAWLRMNASCPVCRTSPLPTPVPTPLSELIPLARHSFYPR